MKNMMSALIISSAMFVMPSCAQYPQTSPKTLAPGEYTNAQRSTSAKGTTTERITNTNVYYDKNGNKAATQETQTSTDPKGLFNKSTSSTTKTYD